MNIKNWIVVLAICSLLSQCQQGKNRDFLITADAVGKLTRSTTFPELEKLFATDSIVIDTDEIRWKTTASKLQVFEKGGAHLLTLTSSTDSVQRIANIRIEDARFVTEKGISLKSTFKDIKEHYTIKKIVTSMNNVILFLKESNVYFTIDKQELPASLRYNGSTNIEEVQIPDHAKIKYMMIGWE